MSAGTATGRAGAHDAPTDEVGAYGDMAEFYELVAEQQVLRSGPLLTAALARVRHVPGPVVEIGAGTGRVTEVIAQALPGAPIEAVEPSPAMRAVLMSRLAADAQLRARTTVGTGTAPGLDLPATVRAAVVFGVAGHLTPGDRATLWGRLRSRLAPGGVVVVELMGVRGSARELPSTCQLRAQVGDLTYEWWVGGVPVAGDAMRFASRWVVLDAHGAALREVHGAYVWHPVGVPELQRESGMRVEPLGGATGSGLPEVAVLHLLEEGLA